MSLPILPPPLTPQHHSPHHNHPSRSVPLHPPLSQQHLHPHQDQSPHHNHPSTLAHKAFGLTEKIRNSEELVGEAFEGNLPGVREWLDKGYHIESLDKHKSTALSEAACAGKLDVGKYLIQNGANPNTRNRQGRTPLFRAAYHGHFDVSEM